jgi:hypothetical protein
MISNKFARAGIIVGFVGLVLITGCANVPKQPFNREAHRDINQITVLEAGFAKEYPVVNVGHAGMSFGLIGALIATADISSKTNQFTKEIAAKGFDAAKEYQDALVAALEKAGYSVRLVKVARPKDKFLDNYASVAGDSQAVLDSTIHAGYAAASGGSDYVPTFASTLRLVRTKGKQVLYQDVINYGYENRQKESVSIASEKTYFFVDFPALMKNTDLALEGMRVGIPLVVNQIAQDLRK